MQDKGVAAVSVIKTPLHVRTSFEYISKNSGRPVSQGNEIIFTQYQREEIRRTIRLYRSSKTVDYRSRLIVLFGKSYTPDNNDY